MDRLPEHAPLPSLPGLSLPALKDTPFPLWYEQLIDVAFVIHPTRTHGLSGLVLSAAEFASMSGTQTPFALHEEPNVAQTSVTNTQGSNAWYLYNAEQAALRQLRMIISKSIGPELMAGHPDYQPQGCGALQITITRLVEYARELYAAATLADMGEIKAILRSPYAGEDIDTFIGRHLLQHNRALSAGQAFSEYDKNQFLADAMVAGDTPAGDFARAIRTYNNGHPLLSKQAFSGANGLSVALRAAGVAIRAVGLQSGGADAANVAPLSHGDAYAAKASEDTRPLHGGQRRHKEPSRPRPNEALRDTTKECPVHGRCGHDAFSCRAIAQLKREGPQLKRRGN